MLQQLINMRKQQDGEPAQQMSQMASPQSRPGSLPSGGADLNDMHGISKIIGFDPKTVFGTPLGQIVSNVPQSVGQPSGALGAMQNIMNGGLISNAVGLIDPQAAQAMNYMGIGGGNQAGMVATPSNGGDSGMGSMGSGGSSGGDSGSSGDDAGGGDSGGSGGDSDIMGNL